MKKFILPALLLLVCTAPAMAWNCSDPLASRVPVATGTAGSYGNGDGQLFLGTGSEGVKGQLYECKVPTPPTDPKPTSPSQSQTQNQSQTQTSNSSSNSTATSSSKTNSSSTSAATGGSSTSTAVGGSSTATGGNAALKNSGNSSLANSGNSSNVNTTNSSASNNGNGANNSTYNSQTTIQEARIPVATAFANAQSTVSCFKGFGVGGQAPLFGASFSGGSIDKNCAILEAARFGALGGSRIAFCKVYITHKAVKAAGVTLEDCMTVPPAPVLNVPVAAPIAPIVPNITVVVPPQPVPVTAVVPTASTSVVLKDLGSCKINAGITNVCKRIADSAVLALESNPELSLALAGPSEGAKVVVYLRTRGVDPNRIRMNFSDAQDWDLSFALWSTN